MAFELVDFNRFYIKRGLHRGLFNVARSDESASSPRYYAYINEDGSYVIQKITNTSGVSEYKYYGAGWRKAGSLDADWTNRASLTYVEYNQLT